MGSHSKQGLLIGVWLTCVAGIVFLLWHEDRFFAVGGIPVANVTRTDRDVTYRSEDDIKWRAIGGGKQGVFDGDKLATGKKSAAQIDFGDGRMADLGADSSLTISTIRQNSGFTYILSLPKGSVSIQNIKLASVKKNKNQFPIIIRSGGRDYLIEPGEERGIVKDDRGVTEFQGKKRPKVLVPKKEVQLASIPPAIAEAPQPIPVEVPLPPPPPPPPPLKPKKPEPKPAPEVTAAGSEVTLDTSDIKTTYFTFQSLASAKGGLGGVKWTSPEKQPADWEPAVELSNGTSKKQVLLIRGTDLDLKVDDFGQISSQTSKDGVPCALLGMRGGARVGGKDKGRWSFSGKTHETQICSYRDAAGTVPIVIGLSSLEASGQLRGKIFPAPSASGLKYQMILTSSSQYLSMLPLMAKSENLRVAKAPGLSSSGVFIAKAGKVIMQLAGSGFNAVAADKVLALTGGDFVFKGSRTSLYDATSFSAEQLKDWVSQNASQGKKVYVQKSGSLLPISRDFLEERREVAAFVKTVASQVFTEKVDIIAYK